MARSPQRSRELLFPALYSQAVLEQAKKDLGAAGYAGQHQQRPAPAEGSIPQRQWWRYWKPRGLVLPPVIVRLPDGSQREIYAIDLPETFDTDIQSWDCSFKDLNTSDFVVGQVHARLESGRYLLHQVRRRVDLPSTAQAIRAMSANYPEATAKLVEDKANGPAVIQSLKHEITGLLEVNPQGGKMSRAAGVSPEVEAGNWYLPHPGIEPWVREFIEECAAFPNSRYVDSDDVANERWKLLKQKYWTDGDEALLRQVFFGS
jgi:predicted phage terminase large subunit-like protein